MVAERMNRVIREARINRISGGKTPDLLAPTISNISDPTGGVWTAGVPVVVTFDVSDDVTPAASIAVSATSNDQNVVADGDIVAGGSGTSRSLTITPTSAGIVTITISAMDLGGNATLHPYSATVTL